MWRPTCTPGQVYPADYETDRRNRIALQRAKSSARSLRQALVEAAREEMLRDPKVFIMGEDVGLYAAPMELRVTCTRNLASGA